MFHISCTEPKVKGVLVDDQQDTQSDSGGPPGDGHQEREIVWRGRQPPVDGHSIRKDPIAVSMDDDFPSMEKGVLSDYGGISVGAIAGQT